MKIFVVTYALTSGIFEVENAEIDGDMALWKSASGYRQYAHGEGRQWTRTREQAVERANEMKVTKIASLKKSLKKMEALTF